MSGIVERQLTDRSERVAAWRDLRGLLCSRSCTSACIELQLSINIFVVGKVVPQHGMEALGRRGGITPTLSYPPQYMGMSGQHHAPAALYPRGKSPRYPLYRRLGGHQSRSGRRG
jgi:hypothetical protein